MKILNVLNLILVLGMFIFLYNQDQKIQGEINQLSINQSLILKQVEESEKEINTLDILIDTYSEKFGIDKKLCHAVAYVESGKNQNAVSPSGSIGVFQLQPRTAKSLGVNPYILEENIKGGVQYLAYLNKKYNGDTDLILAGYNSGTGNVSKYGGVPPFKETKEYIKKVKNKKSQL